MTSASRSPDTPRARVRDPARLAALRALSLHDRRADAALDRLTRLAARTLGAPASLVNIVEADRQVTRSTYGQPDRFRREDSAPLAESICAIAVESGDPLSIDDTRLDPRVSAMSCVAAGVAAYAGVPLRLSSGHCLGSLCVVDSQPRQWTDEQMSTLSDLAAAATTELELIAAAQAAEERAAVEASARRLSAVQQVTDVALNQATLDDTMQAILERLRSILRADTATVLLLDASGQRLEIRASLGLEGEVEAHVSMPIGEGIAGRIAAAREPVIVPDVPAAGPVSPVLRARVRSLVGVPLLIDDSLLGVVHVGTFEPRAFDEDDVRLLALAASRIAAAIERARLFDAERAARIAAEAANRAKSGFLAVMSHELRTPLNAIAGYTQLLESDVLGPVSERQRETLSRISAVQRRLARVIDDILHFVDIEHDPHGPGGALTPLSTVLERVHAHAAPRAGARSIAYEPGMIAARVNVNAAAVEDILLRVLDNALKFTPEGGRVSVMCEERSDAVTITVRDSGPGIPADRMVSVFEPFERADSSYRRSHDGAGLGLAIARARARQLGGSLTAVPCSEGGACIQVTLPRRTAEALPAAAPR